MKSVRDGEGLAGRGRLDPTYLLPSPSPNHPLFFWNIPLSVIIKRAAGSGCGISASGEGRDFSEIIAVFLMRNKRVSAPVASWGGGGGVDAGAQGIFPFRA